MTARKPFSSLGRFQDPSNPALSAFADRLVEWIEVREGLRRNQDPLEQVVLRKDLVDLDLAIPIRGGAAMASNQDLGSGGTGTGSSGQEDGFTLNPPPAPTGLTANGTFQRVLIAFDDPNGLYSYHGYTEIWRAAVDNLGVAVRVSTTPSFVWVDADVSSGTTYYYWIRFVSRWTQADGSEIYGPFNAVSGTPATTAVDVDYVLNVIQGAVTESELYQDLNDRIDLIDTPTTGLIDRMVASEGNVATIQTDVSTLQTDLASEVTARTTLATQLRGAYTGTDITQVTTGLIYSERQARSSADSAMASDITALDTRITTAEGNIAGNATAITSLDTRVTDNEGDITAQASSITQLQTDVGDNTSTIQVQATSINGLESQFTVKIQNDVDGAGTDAVAGFGLSSGPPDETGVSSNFYVLADRFAIAHPGGSEVPFVVTGGNVYLDNLIAQRITVVDAMVDTLNANKLFAVSGTVFELLVNAATAHTIAVSNYIGSSNYVAGSAGWRIHGDGTIEARNITARGNIEATSLQAGTAMINTAHINDAAVDTLQLAGQAVTIPSSAYTSGSITWSSGWQTVQTLSYTATGAPTKVELGVRILRGGGDTGDTSSQNNPGRVHVRLLRNGSTVLSLNDSLTFRQRRDSSHDSEYGLISFPFQDSSSASGGRTYTLQVSFESGVGPWVSSNRFLSALETKR